MLEAQHGLCAICLRPPKEGKRLAVDHNHKTGKVRGLLCWFCNKRLLSNHSEARLRAAADYLVRTDA